MSKFLFCILAITFQFNTSNRLKVIVKGIQIEKGNIVVEVFNSDRTFLKKSILLKTNKAIGKSIDCSFDLPEGTYAVTAYHDINANKKMDKALLGYPLEPYGLSNNYRPTVSIPTFNDCKFTVTDQTTISVKLK